MTVAIAQSSKAPHKQDIEADKKMMLKITKLEPTPPKPDSYFLAIHQF